MSKAQLLFALSTVVPFCALAQNGPVQINQAVVAATGSFFGNGFPYTITKPGSYQLTGNLTVPAGYNGIVIAASNVTLDLNGFNITLLGGGIGVSAMGSPSSISVRHGSITVPDGPNYALAFILVNTGINVQDLMVTSNGGTSILVGGSNSIVKNNIGTGLIEVVCPSVVVENVTSGFISKVIGPGGDCVEYNNRALDFVAPVTQ